MRPNPLFIITSLLLVLGHALPTAAQHRHGYAGEQHRSIKSLSADDVAELRRGGGWGLAKAAELNGLPGPAHLLELKDEIALTSAQTASIERIFLDMRERAITKGATLIELEGRLDHAFRSGNITDHDLRELLSKIAKAREELRYIHLSTHLKTPKILTAGQIAEYNRLRGYR